jgi:hypothetical protein
MVRVHTVFDCQHEKDIDVSIDDDVEIPERVRGLGKCPDCRGKSCEAMIAISGVAPKPGGREIVLDSIMMMPI